MKITQSKVRAPLKYTDQFWPSIYNKQTKVRPKKILTKAGQLPILAYKYAALIRNTITKAGEIIYASHCQNPIEEWKRILSGGA